MYECLSLFSPPTRAWFRHAFSAPTNAQQEAWPHIKAGENVLVVALTSSGKTLAAFLSAIDGLIGEQSGDKPSRPGKPGVKVLYISLLKALGADVERNLRVPLGGIAAQCVAMDVEPPENDVAIRSGGTAAKERRRIAAHPPDILITTPESLYLLLTSKARRILKGVETVIVDAVPPRR